MNNLSVLYIKHNAMKRRFLLLTCLLIIVMSLSAQDPLNLIPPANLQGENPPQTDYAHLTWEEPVDSITSTTPAGLLGYNIYRDGEIIGSIDVPALEYFDLNLNLITYIYHISAVYDLTFYGVPGETGESALEGPVEVTLCCLPELPFIENFTTGVFETNQWTAEGNWQIAGQMGNPAPSAEFGADPAEVNYSYSLTSNWLTGTGFNDGLIYVDFDLKLDGANNYGTEFLYVDVYNGTEWINKATYYNGPSFDWLRMHLDITDEAYGRQFKIRFRAEGENTVNLEYWQIDNINVSRVCLAPVDLNTTHPLGHGYCEILVKWHFPEPTGTITPGWLEWDNGENYSAIGCAGGETFYMASRHTPDQLTEYVGNYLTKIRLFPFQDGGTIVLKVWTGENASQLELSQPVASYVAGEWNEFELDTPFLVAENMELWFGYSAYAPLGAYIPGVDAGPAVAGYGDLISINGSEWESLSLAYGIDLNWNLGGFFEPLNNPRGLNNYNIYRDNVLIKSTTETSYIDTVYVGNTDYCYNVTAVYEDCESGFSNTECYPVYEPCPVGVDDIELNEAEIYPNPASFMITITGKSISQVIIYDILGNQLQQKSIPATQESSAVDVRNLANGVYLVKFIKSTGESTVRKLVVKQ
jgi:hypothetical protein